MRSSLRVALEDWPFFCFLSLINGGESAVTDSSQQVFYIDAQLQEQRYTPSLQIWMEQTITSKE